MKYFLIIAFLLFSVLVQAQPQWINYNPNNSGLPGWIVMEMVIDSTNAKWIATNNGLARFGNNVWTVWDTNNSPIPNNFIQSIVKDKENKIWIATRNKGILKFDGINWTFYYYTNFGYPLLAINRLRIDNNNTLWACSQTLGLLKFYSSLNKWIRYYTGNSGLPDNSVTDVKFEENIKWIGTVMGGIARFDDSSWTVYNTNNTPLISNFIEGVGIDNYNNKWFCTRFGGVAKFNTFQNQWTLYTSTNSGLPWNNTSTVFFDENNVKWIGIQDGGFVTFNDTNWIYFHDSNYATANDFKKDRYGNIWICEEGLTVYNPNGIVNIRKNNAILLEDFYLFQNYPNPFNSYTIIKYYLINEDNINLAIYDITGRKIKTLKNIREKRGEYEYLFDASDLSTGVYFYTLKTNGRKLTKTMILIK
ncbi:MAG: T9SS type A sorting domain-containing protein [Ignavibacteria bacterium]|nr:T9SS type A sorting domain-containing protein [Ignavibacteria bacterium]